jgi:hypothetical protein
MLFVELYAPRCHFIFLNSNSSSNPVCQLTSLTPPTQTVLTNFKNINALTKTRGVVTELSCF